MIGGLSTEFDRSERVCVYINGEKVLEPDRVIVDKFDNVISKPDLQLITGVPKQDAFVMKVVRPRGNVPAIFTVEGWGPAGTLHGFRMCLENPFILSQLAKYESDSFEVVVVVDGVHANEVDGTMTATGPIDIVYRERIRIEPEQKAGILAAIKTLPSEPLRALTADQIEAKYMLYRGVFLP